MMMKMSISIQQLLLFLSSGLFCSSMLESNNNVVAGFSFISTSNIQQRKDCNAINRFCPYQKYDKSSSLLMGLGDYTVELEKPLGLILEERGNDDAGTSTLAGGGVVVKEVSLDGSASLNGQIVPGDVLLQIEEIDVSTADFDTVMDILISSPSDRKIRITLGDGLGVMDMPKNVVSTLASTEDAYFIDAVVRQAVREIRRNGRLGDLLKVEVIIGAGVKEDEAKATRQKRGQVRFFAIFSTDGVSTYSCNVSATGIQDERQQQSNVDDGDGDNNNSIKIVSLSCAKDEGLGRTYDLIQEEKV